MWDVENFRLTGIGSPFTAEIYAKRDREVKEGKKMS